jgi:hypothetical protein
LTLAMHASRTQSTGLYIVSAAVLLTELLKLAACVAFAAARAALWPGAAGSGGGLSLHAAAASAAHMLRTSAPVALPAVLVRDPGAHPTRAGSPVPRSSARSPPSRLSRV